MSVRRPPRPARQTSRPVRPARLVRTVLAVAVALGAIALPSVPAHASGHWIEAECTGTVPFFEMATCENTFPITKAQADNWQNWQFEHPHAHFHDFLAAGSVGFEWRDPNGALIYSAGCTPLGLSWGGTPFLGAFDNSLCGTNGPRGKPAHGTQTFRVVAAAEACVSTTPGMCTFHGRLRVVV